MNSSAVQTQLRVVSPRLHGEEELVGGSPLLRVWQVQFITLKYLQVYQGG